MKIQNFVVAVEGVEIPMAEGQEIELTAGSKALKFQADVSEGKKLDPRIVSAGLSKRPVEVEIKGDDGLVKFKSEESLIVVPRVHDGSFTVQGSWFQPDIP